MRQWSPETRKRLRAAVLTELDRRKRERDNRGALEDNFGKFYRAAWPHIDPATYIHGYHIDAVTEHLEAVTRGHIRRLIINMPPRFSKSLLCSVAWPAWTWAQRDVGPLSGPQVKFLYSSYSNRFAKRDGRKTKRLLASPWYQNLWGERTQLKASPDTDEYFESEAGGFRFATSVNGGVTGEGGDALVVDDPINAKKSNWESARLDANEWWDEVMTSRLNDQVTGAKVIVMQRLHEDDLVGHVLAKELGEQYEQLILPMEFDWKRPATIIGWEDWREDEGELLWPERFPESVVENLKADLGPFAASAQLQQSPSPRGGGIIERDWWKLWPPEEPFEYFNTGYEDDPDSFPAMSLIVGSVDTSYGEKDENAYNAMTIWGVWQDRRERPQVMLMDAWRKRLPLRGVIPEGLKTDPERRPHWGLVEHVANSVRNRHIDVLLIEDKTRGHDLRAELIRLLRPSECQIVMIQPKLDKTARLHAVQPMFASGMVWAPNKASVQMVIDEVSQFPKAKYRDLCDTASQALSYLRRNDLLLMAAEADEETIKRNSFQPQRPSPYDV